MDLDPPDLTDRALRAMAAVAALRAAAVAGSAIAHRRAGCDPADQEAEPPVRAYLSGACEDLTRLGARLRVAFVLGHGPPPADDAAVLVQAFELRLGFSQLARDLHVVHQKLLSLYPAVSPALPEAARLLGGTAQALVEADEAAVGAAMEGLLGALNAFVEDLADALRPPN